MHTVTVPKPTPTETIEVLPNSSFQLVAQSPFDGELPPQEFYKGQVILNDKADGVVARLDCIVINTYDCVGVGGGGIEYQIQKRDVVELLSTRQEGYQPDHSAQFLHAVEDKLREDIGEAARLVG